MILFPDTCMSDTECRLKCPCCEQPISFWNIAFTSFPVWLKCWKCKERLRGDGFVQYQGWLFVLATIVVFWAMFRWYESIAALCYIVGGFVLFAIVMVFLTLRCGSYTKRP